MNYWKRQSLIGAVLIICFGACAAAATWNEPVAGLARDIAAVTGPSGIALSVQNSSSIPAHETAAIRRLLQEQLRSAGVRFVDASMAASEVTVTLSENLTGYLWVAAIRQGTDTRVVISSVPRPPVAAASHPANAVVLRKKLLWSQALPVLDAVLLAEGSPAAQLLVLDPEKVSLLRQKAGSWELEQMLPVTHTHNFPRDVRGRLIPARDHLVDAYLPGVVCSTTAATSLSMKCRESDDPWPLLPGAGQFAFFGSARNFFTGVLAPGIGKQSGTAPFYSAAAVARSHDVRLNDVHLNDVLWFFSGVDGRIRASGGVNEVILHGVRDWGSNIAAVSSTCGTMLLADNGDSSAPGMLRAYDVVDREPAAGSEPLEFPGPVTALWSLTEGSGATVVARNLEDNKYEAYAVAISCP